MICIKIHPTIDKRQAVRRTPLAPHNRNGAPAMCSQSTAPRQCVVCAITLTRRPQESSKLFADRTTCSAQCRALLGWSNRRQTEPVDRSPIPERACEGCGTSFKPIHRDGRFCSSSCSSRAAAITRRSRGKWGARVTLTCDHCAQPFSALESELISPKGSLKRFCSHECHSASRRHADREFACPQCGMHFVTRKSHQRTYCSHRCHNKARLSDIRFRVSQMEQEIVAGLVSMGYDVSAQQRIGRFTVDALIPSEQTIVEFNGDYFHCNPAIYPNGPKDSIQHNNVERDKKRTPYLESLGYRVVVIWERDLVDYGVADALERAGLRGVPPSD